MKSTNYYNTFIEVAEDCPVESGVVPPLWGNKKTVARLQYEMIAENSYTYTSDDVLFTIYARKEEIPAELVDKEREVFFSKGRACLRTSALGKRYGWGLHFDEEGKVALYGVESEEYLNLVDAPGLKHLKAMRSGRN